MGKPTAFAVSAPEYIGCGGDTRGTETSKYPEEQKSTEIPLVAASERGPALKRLVCYLNSLESLAIQGDSPVSENYPRVNRVGRDT